MIRIAAALALVIACGSSKPAPAAPGTDPAALARDLDRDLRELAEIARRLRGHCAELLAELRPLVSRMRAHAGAVKQALRDPALAKRLRAEVRAYDHAHRGMADQIGEDLAASYLACDRDEALIRAVDLIPEL